MDVRSKRVLLTGADGFTGKYVSAHLAASGIKTVRLPETVDLRDAGATAGAVKEANPTHVIHLAAISFVAHDQPDELYQVNALGTLHLLEALRDLVRPVKRVILASSANIYGRVDALPIAEDTPARPQNHYAASKVAMEAIARVFVPALPITLLRPFNYTGPGQGEQFLVPKIVAHFKERAAQIQLGNVEVSRDFSDVRDIALVYRRLLDCSVESGTTVNFCSGKSHSIGQILAILEQKTGHQINIVVDPGLIRSSEIKSLVGSHAKLKGITGYTPSYNLEATLVDMLAHNSPSPNLVVEEK